MKVSELFGTKGRSVLSVMGEQPEHLTYDFSCSEKELTSLEGAPKVVSGGFDCQYNNLTSLEGAPSSVGNIFNCAYNKLTSLDGAPSSVGGYFSCYNNKLTSLHNIHKQIKKIYRYANFIRNPIKSHVLGLLLIDRLQKVYLDKKEVQNIINKHIKGDRDIFACQEELIEDGFEEYAQL